MYKNLYRLFLLLLCTTATYAQSPNWNQIIKAAATDRGQTGFVTDRLADDQFGWAAAIDGDYAVVGAHQEDENTSGGATLPFAGSVYVFKQTAGVWNLQQKLVPSDRAAGDYFGWSVGISGNQIIVGAFFEDEDAAGAATAADAGSAYIFKQVGGVWVQQQKIVAADRAAGDRFGYRVAIHADYAIIGASEEDDDVSGGAFATSAGSAYIFKQTAGTWTQQQKIVASDRAANDLFGASVSIHGDYAIVGAPQEDENAAGSSFADNAGSAYIFKQTAGVWIQQQKIVATDRAAFDNFAYSISIHGDYAIVGAQNEDEDASGAATALSAGSAYIFKQTAGVWAQQQKIVATDRAADDRFGFSVSIHGDYVAVGAVFEDENATGAATALSAGSAYIFKQTAGTWAQQQKIVSADRAASDNFGWSIAISGDYIIAGAYNEDEDASGSATLNSAGSAYIFKQTTGTWSQQQKIVATRMGAAIDDRFGFSVSISGDYAIVGAYQEDEDASGGAPLTDAGSAYIFKKTAGVWVQQQKIVASDRGENDNFGSSVAINGDYAIVGAHLEDEDASGGATLNFAGSAYIFKQTAGVWTQQQKIVASDRDADDYFGIRVAINGDYAIVGAFREDEDASGGATITNTGSAYIFKQTAGVWAQQQKIVASDRANNDIFGFSVAINGDYAIVGAYLEDENASGGATETDAGSAYIFKQTAGVWTQQQKIVASDRASNDYFGNSVAISGDYAIVGAFREDEDASGGATLNFAGSAYIFKQTAGVWTQQQKIVASDRAANDYFGIGVSISGDYAIVGAYFEDQDASGGATLSNAGSAYIFKQTAGTWAQQQKIVASDRAIDDNFGSAVAISGDYAIVGAPLDNEDALGTNTISNTGSVYIYQNFGPLWYLDADNDTYYSSTQVSVTSPGTGWTTTLPAGGSGDCDDSNATINPGAAEICGNATDENCNGAIDEGCPPTTPNCYITLTGNPQTVNIPHNVALSPISTSLTAEFTIKRNSNFSGSPQSQIVLHKKDPANYNDNQLGYSIIILQSGDPFGAYKPLAILGDGTNYEDFYPTNAADNTVLGVWSHWAFIYNAITHTGQWYKDGAAVPTTKVSNANVAGILSTFDLNIGGANIPSFPNVYLNADLDEVRLWNTARTPVEIANNKNTSLTGSETGLFAYYNFNNNTANGSGQTVLNKATITGAAINGTTTGGVTTPAFSCAGPKTWNGGTTQWNLAANWTPVGIPTATDDVIIPNLPNDPAIGFIPGSVRDINIADGVTISVNSGIALYVNGHLTAGNGSGSTIAGAGGVMELNGSDAQQINGNLTVRTLRINNQSMGGVDVLGTLNINNALIMIDGDVNANSGTVTLKSNASATAYLDNFSNVTAGTYSGNLTIERYIANTADGYRNISSPVNTTVADLADDMSISGQDGVNCWYNYNPYPNVQVYNEAANNGLSTPAGNYYTGWISKTGLGNPMNAMRGFAIRTYAGAPYTIDLTGPPYNGSKSADITNTPSATPGQDGWNFIGNPYPSPISWTNTDANNPGATTGSYYVFNTTGEYTGNWGSWNGTTGTNGASDIIASMQGFFVKTMDSYNYVEATNASRVASATIPFFKSYNTQPNEIRLGLHNQTNSDEIVAYTHAAATWNEDPGHDAVKIPAGSTIYLSYKQLGKEYAINVIDEITETTELPLVLWVQDTGTYTFEATELNVSGYTTYLKDAELNTLTDLGTTSSVTIPLNGQQTYEGRYSIVFKSIQVTSGITDVNEGKIKIYSHHNIAVVERNSNQPATITITNTLGQTIKEVTTDSKRTEITLDNNNPWYAIIKVKEANATQTKKVFIN